MLRKNQNLDHEIDVTPEEYKEAGSIRMDYRQNDDDLWVVCDFDFLRNLCVGDELMMINEETQNYSPWIISVELSEYEGEKLDNTVYVVTRKIYSATELDVYVVPSENE